MASIIKRTYKVRTADGRTIVKECDHYTIQYRDAAGKIRRKRGYRDKSATKQLAARLERAVALGAEGLVDPYKADKARPTSEHLRDYVADLKTQGRDDKYVETMSNRLETLIDECPWPTLGDVHANTFVRWRSARAAKHVPGQSGETPAATTLNQFLSTAAAFMNWCASKGRIEGVTIAGRKKGSQVVSLVLAGVAKVDGEPVRNRRALSPEDVAKLIDKAPADRALVYRAGIATALRRQELADLIWGDVRLNAIKPYIALRKMATKARRADAVSLPPTLATDLRKARGDAKDTARVFARVPSMKVWRSDLKAAGITYKDEMGRQADFHGGTRKTMNTRLSREGVGTVKAMRMMRVTDSRLVTHTYTDDSQLGLEDALPEMLPASATEAPAQAQAAGA